MIVRVKQDCIHHHVITLIFIYCLRDSQVARKGTQHVCVFTAQRYMLLDPDNHIAQGHFNAAVQIFMHAHCDQMRQRFGAGKTKCEIIGIENRFSQYFR